MLAQKLSNWQKILISWSLITATGIYSFYLSKQNIDQHRYEHMKVRERMKAANEGEYEPSYRKF